jgi:hypothetical protein
MPDEPPIEQKLDRTAQRAYEQNLRAAEREHDLANDLGKRLMEASTRDAQEAIKIVLLVNSGAAVAVLAFVSTLAARREITLAAFKGITHSLYWFTGGIIVTAVASALAYVCNNAYAGYHFRRGKFFDHPYVRESGDSRFYLRLGKWTNWAGVILGFTGLGLFIRGVYVAAHAIEKLVF